VSWANLVFKKVFQCDHVPEPKHVHSTSWNTDEFAYGSYSSRGVGVTQKHIDALSEPEGDYKNLLFAGEHTSPNLSATVHGGFLTGLREAYRIVKK